MPPKHSIKGVKMAFELRDNPTTAFAFISDNAGNAIELIERNRPVWATSICAARRPVRVNDSSPRHSTGGHFDIGER
jgi:hypothetical protein